MSIASLSPPTPYTALMSLLSVALSSVTAKSSSMIPSDPSRVNIQPARKHCSTCPEAVLNFHGIDAQLRRFRCAFLTAYAGKLAEYTVHLGSGVVHLKSGMMIPVLPVHSQHRGRIFLPFADDDPKTAEIISKVLLFAEDEKIKDPMILEYI